MTALKWEMMMAREPVKAGKVLDISVRGLTGDGVFFVLRDEEEGSSAVFLVQSHANIGGNNYVFIKDQMSSLDELIVARLLDRDRVAAMDKDRFSSLLNAFNLALEEKEKMQPEELEKILSQLPAKKVDQ